MIVMPFPMKIQPIDSYTHEESLRCETVKPVVKSRLKRLLERQFPSVLRINAVEKTGVEESHFSKDGISTEFEPSSVCLAKMVQNFIEESNEKQLPPVRCGRNRCNCFNGNCTDSSEDEFDFYGSGFGDSTLTSSGEACEILKSLVPCASIRERNLLADTAKIVEKNKICKRKDDFCRNLVTDGLLALGYDASVCKSRWEKSSSYPAGEYEYIDVIVEGERLLIDIDFRSEFEIARSTKSYKAILQTLPHIFVGKPDRLQKIISIVSEASRQSLKKKGMHFPPWRKAEYVKSKWLSPYTRTTPTSILTPTNNSETHPKSDKNQALIPTKSSSGELDIIFREDNSGPDDSMFVLSESSVEEEKTENTAAAKQWNPPEIKPKKSLQIAGNIVTGFASVIRDGP